MGQLFDYLPSIHTSITPWLLIVSDFQTFEWYNLIDQSEGEFKLSDLQDNLTCSGGWRATKRPARPSRPRRT